jgi:hypothetical protein
VKEVNLIILCSTNQTQAGRESTAKAISQGSPKQNEMTDHQKESRVFLRQSDGMGRTGAPERLRKRTIKRNNLRRSKRLGQRFITPPA